MAVWCGCVCTLPFGQLFCEQLLPHSSHHVLAHYFLDSANLVWEMCLAALTRSPVPFETVAEIWGMSAVGEQLNTVGRYYHQCHYHGSLLPTWNPAVCRHLPANSRDDWRCPRKGVNQEYTPNRCISIVDQHKLHTAIYYACNYIFKRNVKEIISMTLLKNLAFLMSPPPSRNLSWSALSESRDLSSNLPRTASGTFRLLLGIKHHRQLCRPGNLFAGMWSGAYPHTKLITRTTESVHSI